jgi:hypothetical protein
MPQAVVDLIVCCLRLFHGRAQSLAFIIFVAWCVAGAPASACMTSCASSEEAAARYDQVFSGLIISTEIIPEPTVDTANPDGTAVREFRFWTKTRILVLRIWRGAPPTIAEVWTPGGSSCDLPMIAGFPFVALARVEKGRSVARHTDCEGDPSTAAAKGRGAYTDAGVAIIAATFCVVALTLTWTGFAILRLKRSDRPSPRLPSALCFVAAALPVAPVIYLVAFQSVVAAMIGLVILLFWSRELARLSDFDFRRRNTGWLLANVAGVVSIIALMDVKLGRTFGDVGWIDTLTSSADWIFVAVASVLSMCLLNALKAIQSRPVIRDKTHA